MKAAFSVWGQRIAPLFDTARQIHLVESREGRLVSVSDHALPGDLPQRIAWLAEQGVDTLVCGAVSRAVQEQVAAAGLALVSFVAGDLRQIIPALADGSLKAGAFNMPGCCGRRRMRRQRGGAGCCAARQTI